MPNKENTVIIQPVAAIEQHGPHLPLAVDSTIGLGVLGKTLEALDLAIPAYSLPNLYYGKSNEHWHFPGTITLSASTLINVLLEVAESLYRAGFRKLILMNSHGGQPEIMNIVARDIHQKYADFLIFPFFTWKVTNIVAELFDEKEVELGIHGGAIETSLMLTLLPEQVRMDKAVCEFPPELPPESMLSMEGNLPFAWVTQELSQSGVLGDATKGSKEKGDRLLEALVKGWLKAITEVYHFRQPQVN